MESFGCRMKALRKERNLSQNELSEITGIKQTTLSAIEQRQDTPRGETLEIISDALDVPLLYWFQEPTVIQPDEPIVCPMCGHHFEDM